MHLNPYQSPPAGAELQQVASPRPSRCQAGAVIAQVVNRRRLMRRYVRLTGLSASPTMMGFPDRKVARKW